MRGLFLFFAPTAAGVYSSGTITSLQAEMSAHEKGFRDKSTFHRMQRGLMKSCTIIWQIHTF